MPFTAPRRSAALVATLGIIATGFVAVSPAVASESEVITTSESRDTLTIEGSGSFESVAVGTVQGVLRWINSSGVPTAATTGQSGVAFLKLNDNGRYVYEDYVETFGAEGSFSLTGLEPGTYRVEFYTFNETALPNRQYWENGQYWFEAVDLVLADDASFDFGTVTIGARDINFNRIAGSDRFSTSVQISRAAYPNVPGGGVPVVYVVNGRGFADALSAGPAAAASEGVMLLTESNMVPSVVRSELNRLNPQKIVIVGGTAVISNSVRSTLQNYVDSNSDVVRIAGADRFATSRAIVDDAFGDEGLDNLFIATGWNFPDALAAGPASSRIDGAVLLVSGNSRSADSATRSLLTKLGKPNLYLAGGTAAISSGMAQSLSSHVSPATLTRYAGASRYDTASLINDAVFGPYGADFGIVAAGTNFPDALAGGPLAGLLDAPLHLAERSCIPEEAALNIIIQYTSEVLVLGGSSVLTSRVVEGRVC